MTRLAFVVALLLSGCVSAPIQHDQASTRAAIQTMQSQGVGLWVDGCWEFDQAVGALKPYLREESLALATSWGLVMNEHLDNHGIQSNVTRVPLLCASESKRRVLASRENQSAIGRGTPHWVDSAATRNTALRSGLETVICQTKAKVSERYPLFKSTCDKTLSPVSQQALSAYFNQSRYILMVDSHGQSSSVLNTVIAGAIALPAIALASGVVGLTVAGPAGLNGDSNAAKSAVRLVDAGGPSGGTDNASRIFSHGMLYDVKTQRTLWYSDYAATQAISCGKSPSTSNEAARIFGPLLCG